MTLTPGATLGPYTIRAELGHGGMGVVYTAQDPRLKRQVAIKLLTADLTRDESVAYDSGFTATDAGNIVLTASVIPLPATRTSRRRGNRASFATPSLVRP